MEPDNLKEYGGLLHAASPSSKANIPSATREITRTRKPKVHISSQQPAKYP
jgi:hypothetical protein